MGFWRLDKILLGLITVFMLGIFLFRDKTTKE